MNTPIDFEHQLASYMELFSNLSMELPDAISGLASLAVETLIAGGKLILVSDESAECAVKQLCFMLNHSSTDQKPELPLIDFRKIHSPTSGNAGVMLNSITRENDLIIVFTERLENILMELTPEQTLVICAAGQNHPTTPTLALNSQSQQHWLISLTVIVNHFSQLVEAKLFGAGND